jgi:hypothetical protein
VTCVAPFTLPVKIRESTMLVIFMVAKNVSFRSLESHEMLMSIMQWEISRIEPVVIA